jgi:hypothetical protein
MTAPIGPNMVAETSSQVYVFMNPNGVAFPPVTIVSALSAIIAITPATTPSMMAVIIPLRRDLRLTVYIDNNQVIGFVIFCYLVSYVSSSRSGL